MDIPTDLPGILSEFGLPAKAMALAYGLVKGADALEADAKEERLKEISALLKERSFTSLGKLGASVVPFVFEKIFGSRVFSVKFISRSIFASVLFWLILLSVKGFPILWILRALKPDFDVWIVATILFVDWLSLVKAKFLLDVMSKINPIFWIVVFVAADITLTYCYLRLFLLFRVIRFCLDLECGSCLAMRLLRSFIHY
jgi:hypothetical protein